ncbi:hypothetical protein INT45_000221 [Circinella minor]|uniref:F-box domain-containing protein n=1 Tax=Circinella minor TaxID=1195481 RepID=A0A8H7S4H6_9FUNG|nr:hypothetical protein INT45_000221 [Circinella minor]
MNDKSNAKELDPKITNNSNKRKSYPGSTIANANIKKRKLILTVSESGSKSSTVPTTAATTKSTAVSLIDELQLINNKDPCHVCQELCSKKSLKYRSLPVGGRLDSNDQMLCLECRRKLISDHPNHQHYPDRETNKIVIEVGGLITYELMTKYEEANVKRMIFRKKEKKKKKQHAVLVSINNMSESSGSNIVKTTLPLQQLLQHAKSNSNSNDIDIDNSETKMKSITDFLNELPAKIFLNVFASFSSEQLGTAALVCPDLYNRLVNANTLWHHFQLNHHDKAAFIIMKSIGNHVRILDYTNDTTELSVKHKLEIGDGNIEQYISARLK